MFIVVNASEVERCPEELVSEFRSDRWRGKDGDSAVEGERFGSVDTEMDGGGVVAERRVGPGVEWRRRLKGCVD